MAYVSNYKGSEIDTGIRKSISPSEWVSYLPIGSDFTTPTILANTPTKVKIPTTPLFTNEFGVVDLGGGNLAVQYQGPDTRRFSIIACTGIQTGANQVIVRLSVYKNGALIPGVSTPRKISTGTDTGAVPVSGQVTLSNGDYIEVYIESDTDTTVTFVETSIQIMEVN